MRLLASVLISIFIANKKGNFMWLLLVSFDNCEKLNVKDQENDDSSPRIKVTIAQNVFCRVLLRFT